MKTQTTEKEQELMMLGQSEVGDWIENWLKESHQSLWEEMKAEKKLQMWRGEKVKKYWEITEKLQNFGLAPDQSREIAWEQVKSL